MNLQNTYATGGAKLCAGHTDSHICNGWNLPAALPFLFPNACACVLALRVFEVHPGECARV